MIGIKEIGLTMAAVVVSFVVAELVLRVTTEPYPNKDSQLHGLVEFHPVLGWFNNANLDLKFYDHRVRTNSEGFRGDEYDGEEILLLGDSFGWGWGVPEDSCFASLIDGVYNMSVTGYGTDQELLLYADCDKPHKLVILQLYSNDIWYNYITNVLYYARKPRFVWDETRLIYNAPVPLKLYEEVHRWAVMNTRLFGLLWKTTHKRFSPPVVPQDYCENGAWRKTLMLLRTLQQVAESKGAELLVVAFAGNDWFGWLGSYELFINDCNNIGIPTLALDCEEIYESGLWVDGKHWNCAGHRMVAKRINEYLQ